MRSKSFVALLLLLTAGLLLYEKAAVRAEPRKLWVFFKDRSYLMEGRLPAPAAAGFAEAAIQRRQIRGLSEWNASDFPVDPSYIRKLRAAGAQVLVESRWLNAASVLCDDGCLKRLKGAPFIAGVQPVVTYHRPLEKITRSVESAGSSSPTAPEALSYGNSKDQLTQLKVPFAHQKGFAGQNEIVAIFDSGFRKDHIAFKNKVIVAQHDFVFGDDNVSDGGEFDSHGTGTWSCVGGEAPGKLYGPAYQAKFILADTEDIRTETQVEEDNWVAAFEWADRLGASVISSSLGYTDWYKPSDFNGMTPVTSRVASTAARKGIVVVNSAGNSGPAASTLGAPADAFDILAVGAVGSTGIITGFSSRGPTADGRLKPEVVARGQLTWLADNSGTDTFGRSSGTSFSCPLVAGCSAVLLSAHPDWNPLQVRETFIHTASRKDTPDNTYGYGIPNMQLALDYLPTSAVVIEHNQLKDTSNTSQPYRVIARIRAQRGLNENQLFLFWKREGSGKFTKVPLVPVPGGADRFQADIPAQSKGTTILYYLTAKDVNGKGTRAPFKAPQNLFQFRIL